MRQRNGFTLIELLIVIVILGVLVSIAVPSYREYVRRANRRAAQAEMMEIANRERQYLLANRRYAEEHELNYTLPDSIAQNYDWDIEVGADAEPSFEITFEPVDGSGQDGDVNLTLSSTGVKSPADKW
jgi:type IV pilus assembly protein PilE